MSRKRKKDSKNYQIANTGVSGKRRHKTAKYRVIGIPKIAPLLIRAGICEDCHIRKGVLRADGKIRCVLCTILGSQSESI